MKKNAVAATSAIDISQNDIPTKSSDSKLAAAEAKFGRTPIIEVARPSLIPLSVIFIINSLRTEVTFGQPR
jgi:hypothetical protein